MDRAEEYIFEEIIMRALVFSACLSLCNIAQAELNDINCDYDYGNDVISFSLETPEYLKSSSITLKNGPVEIAHVVISNDIFTDAEYQMSLFFRENESDEFILDSAASLYNDQREYSLFSWDGGDIVRRLTCKF